MPDKKGLKRRIAIAILLAVLILFIYLVYANIRQLRFILAPFLMAAVIAYLLAPLVERLEIRHLPRWLAIILVYFSFLLLLAIGLRFLIPELYRNIQDLLSTLPAYTDKYRGMVRDMGIRIQTSRLPNEVKGVVITQFNSGLTVVQGWIVSMLQKALSLITGVFGLFFNLILSLVIAFYFIRDQEVFKAGLISLTPRRWRRGILAGFSEINEVLTGFIQGELMVAGIVGFLEFILLSLVGVRYSLLLGIIGGVSNLIPYFGPFIGAVPAVLLAFLDYPLKAVWAALVFIGVQQADNVFITPRIISYRVGLHPVSIIFLVLLGGRLGGILGMVTAVPLGAVLKVIGRRIINAIT